MSTVFPTNLDAYSNPAGTDDVSIVLHSTQHANHNDSIEALEAKVGIDSSADTTSLDYKLKSTSSSNPGHKHTLANGATDVTATVTEINYVDGVTSAIQTQLDGKAASLGADDNYVTDAEKVKLSNLSGTNTGDQDISGKADKSGALTQFVGNTAWRVFYSDTNGDVAELALGADGTFLKSNGAALAPSFSVPAGTGDVSKVGTPVNNQVGVWTGDGTIEGDAALTYDSTTDTLTSVTFAGNLTGNVTGNVSGTSATVTGAAQAAITSLGTLTALQVDNININGNTIISSDVDGNINLTPNGTGKNILANAQVSSLTASEIVITDASKNLVSAAVATYPSLTELTYVKGVTSAIQTQLNAKAASLGADDNYVTDAQLVVIGNTSGTNTGDQTITNSSDATSHTVTLSASGGSVQLIEGSNITLTTGGTAGAGTVTIASTGGSGATAALDNLAAVAINAALVLGTSDAFALGSATKMWSDLFLASGAVINFNNGNLSLTHSAGVLANSGKFLSGTNASTADYSNAQAIFSQANTGDTLSGNVGVVGEANTSGATNGNGVYGWGGVSDSTDGGTPHGGYFGADAIHDGTNIGVGAYAAGSGFSNKGVNSYAITSAAGGDSMGVWGDAGVSDSTDTGTSYGLYGSALETHSGGINVGVYAEATGSAINNYAIWSDQGTNRFDDTSIFGAVITPQANDGAAIGTTALQWSDLFLAEGGVINWDNGDATLTQVGDVVTLAGADLKVTSPGNVSTSVLTTDATQTLTNKTLTSPTLTTPSAFTTGGTITLAENTSIALDPAGSADGKYSGITVTGTAGYTQAFGDLVYLDPTDSRWEACDANSAAAADGDSRGILGMVVSTGTDGTACTILLQGIIRADANFPALTINAPVYVAETAGDIVVTQPTTADVVIRVVGFAITADEIYFNPSPDYITHT